MPPRALFLCPTLDAGGAESHWSALLPRLAAQGVAARVVAIEGGGRALEELRNEGIPIRELHSHGVGSLKVLPALFGERRHRPTVVVTWGYNAHALGAMFCRLLRVPQLLNWHRQPGLPMTMVQKSSISFAARAGAGAIAVTEAQIPDLNRLGMPSQRIRVVPNGTTPHEDADADADHLRGMLSLPANTFIAVLVARLRPEKRVNDFLTAMSQLSQTVPNVLGVIVGEGPEETALRTEAERLEAPVLFVGHQRDPRRYMRAADVVCLTSEFEALPMALVEAASVGRPIIATDVGGTREIVQEGMTGLLIRPKDPSSFAGALRQLSGQADLRREMGRNASALWRTQFSIDAMVARYAELLTLATGPPTRWPASI